MKVIERYYMPWLNVTSADPGCVYPTSREALPSTSKGFDGFEVVEALTASLDVVELSSRRR